MDTELLYPTGESVEILEADIPHLGQILEKVNKNLPILRVVDDSSYVMRCCIDCAEVRAVEINSDVGEVTRCRELRNTICGDIGDDMLLAGSA